MASLWDNEEALTVNRDSVKWWMTNNLVVHEYESLLFSWSV